MKWSGYKTNSRLGFRGIGKEKVRALAFLFAIILSVSILSSLKIPGLFAASDSTVTVSSTPITNAYSGEFKSELLGANITPWGPYWPDNQYDSKIADMGLGIMRIGHGEKVLVDMESWAPTKGAAQNYNAVGVLGSNYTFNDQIAWWNSLNMPILYNLGDELSCAMTTNPTNCQNGSGAYGLDYAEIGRVWSNHIQYLVNQGVDVRYVEIGNEVNIQPMEGIEYPPVNSSSLRNGDGTGCFIDVNGDDASPGCSNITRNKTQTSNNDYMRIWNAVYPLIKQKNPNIKVGMYASGNGPVSTPYFPYDQYSSLGSNKPDFYPVHQYLFAGNNIAPQRVLDATWGYTGKYWVDWDGYAHDIKTELAGIGWTNPDLMFTEFNYDGGGSYTTANQMWDAMYYASVTANTANYGSSANTYWELFAGSNTDELIDDIYNGPANLRSGALAMRLLKQFKGNTILQSSVTTSDTGTVYDWMENPLVGNTPQETPASKRIESLATRDSGGNHKILLINKNTTTQHVVGLNITGATNNATTIKVYGSRASLANQVPTTTTNVNLSGGSTEVTLPAMSMAIVDVTSQGGGGILGDVNGDGHVNISDASLLMAKWNQSVSGDPADLNSDGVVNILDASVIMSNWGI